MPTIRIDQNVWDELKTRAEPFVDSPNSVLRRLLGLDQGKAKTASKRGSRREERLDSAGEPATHKRTNKRGTKARSANSSRERNPPRPHDERWPIIAEELRRLGRPATYAELFERLESDLFLTERRVAAAVRADKKKPIRERFFERGEGNTIALRGPLRA